VANHKYTSISSVLCAVLLYIIASTEVSWSEAEKVVFGFFCCLLVYTKNYDEVSWRDWAWL